MVGSAGRMSPRVHGSPRLVSTRHDLPSHCCVSTSSFTPRIQGRLQRQALNSAAQPSSAGSFQLGRNFKEFHSLNPVSVETICRKKFSYPQLSDWIASLLDTTNRMHSEVARGVLHTHSRPARLIRPGNENKCAQLGANIPPSWL